MTSFRKQLLGGFILMLWCLYANAEFKDYWFDDNRHDPTLSEKQQLKRQLFEKTDKIKMTIHGEILEDGIPYVENKSNYRITFKFDMPQISKIEITDILLESMPGFAELDTKFPTNIALLNINSSKDFSEFTLSFQDLKSMHLKGYSYSEIVLMVKVKSRGKNYYTVQRLKVHI